MLRKCSTQCVRKFGKASSCQRTGKGQSSSQFPRRVVPKNVLTIGQLYSSPTLVSSCLKSCMLGFSIMQAKNFQMSMLGLEKESNTHWIIEKAREFEKSIYLYFTDYTKAFDCVDHDKLWKALKEMGIPGCLTYLLRNLYASQEATVRTLYGMIDWFKIEKGVRQGCLLSSCLFNLYAECWAGWVTSSNQDRQEKHQKPQMWGWYYSSGKVKRN